MKLSEPLTKINLLSLQVNYLRYCVTVMENGPAQDPNAMNTMLHVSQNSKFFTSLQVSIQFSG
jgi:hypothetical protein